MTRQEYVHIRNLSWDLLIDAKISEYPVDLCKIAKLYNIKYEGSMSYYETALYISREILKIFGYKTEQEYVESLAVRMLSPVIIIQYLNIQSVEKLSRTFGLPRSIAIKRLDRYIQLANADRIGMSRMEMRVLNQFTHTVS